ncbi:MAG: SCP2 sterol-binding domain-containing protein [Halobacteriota archaeon]|nr:SCP2 sterol-binding domain-containing protein [Halobacteriota archaeon]
MVNLVEFTEKIMEVAENDEQVQKSAKKTHTTLSIGLTGGEYESFSLVIDAGKITFSREEIPDAEYKVEMSKDDYEAFLDGKIAGMKMMKAITIVKGSLMSMRKLSSVFECLPRIAKELKADQIEMTA